MSTDVMYKLKIENDKERSDREYVRQAFFYYNHVDIFLFCTYYFIFTD